jgi:dTDP-4-dehydrorhamnose 3,5-epimerase
MAEPKIFKGGISVDDRGEVSFVNDFNFPGIKRFYTLFNHKSGFIRAWHGHKNEEKYFHVIQGASLICAVEIDNWNKPDPKLDIKRFTISSKSPSVLYIPKGYANGTMSLTDDCRVIVF